MPDIDTRVALAEQRLNDLDARQRRTEEIVASLKSDLATTRLELHGMLQDLRDDFQRGNSALEVLVRDQMQASLQSVPEWAARRMASSERAWGVWAGVAGTLVLAVVTILVATRHVL